MKNILLLLLFLAPVAYAKQQPEKKKTTVKKQVKKPRLKTYKPIVYRVIPNCVECRATGYYAEGTEKGNGNK